MAKSSLFTSSKDYYELKTRIHDRLLDLMDLTIIGSMDDTILRQEIRKLVGRILSENHSNFPLNMAERETLFREIHNEVTGLGPLEPFMQDPTVADILVNTHKHIYVERFGKLEPTEAGFKDEAHLRRIIDKIASAVGGGLTNPPHGRCPLPDGSQSIIIPLSTSPFSPSAGLPLTLK
jgi:pilus assembly protein CpaF